MAAHDDEACVLAYLRMLLLPFPASLDEIVHALVHVGHALRGKEYQSSVGGKPQSSSGFGLVGRGEEAGVDGVGYGAGLLSLQEPALACFALQPVAARYKGDASAGEHALLASPGGVGEVVAAVSGQIGAVGAVALEPLTPQGEVAYRRGGPDVVHRPYHRLSRVEYLADILQREHALVYPVQMDDVCLLEFGQLCDVGACVGGVYLPQMAAVQPQMEIYRQSFPQEIEVVAPRLGQTAHRDVLCLLVAHQHLGFYAAVVERFHQPARSHSRSASPLARVDD